jgi:hypothetical protein
MPIFLYKIITSLIQFLLIILVEKKLVLHLKKKIKHVFQHILQKYF